MPRISSRFLDPAGAVHGLPTYPWRCAPEGLATRRQLTAAGLRPGGAAPVAQLMWPRRGDEVGFALLYNVAASVPKRAPTPGNLKAVAAMLAARSTCRVCGTVHGFCLPAGRTCWRCESRGASATAA